MKQDVVDRAHKRFLSGDPKVSVQINSPINITSPDNERWPAQFYTQRELQQAVRDQETRKQILFRLVPGETTGLLEREKQLKELDQKLLQQKEEINKRMIVFEEAEEDFQRVKASKEALKRFEEAGVGKLTEIQADQSRIGIIEETLQKINEMIIFIKQEASQLETDSIKNDELKISLDGVEGGKKYKKLLDEYEEYINGLKGISSDIQNRLDITKEKAESLKTSVRSEVVEKVIKAGGKAEDLNQFDVLTASAAGNEKTLDAQKRAKREHSKAREDFIKVHGERSLLIEEQRKSLRRVADKVKEKFPDLIQINILYNGIYTELEKWLLSLKEPGITRWWNNQKTNKTNLINPKVLRTSLNKKNLSALGMSNIVAGNFIPLMSPTRRFELAALRNDDKYNIQLKAGTGSDDYRDIDELSGGAQVSVLLSLVLETDDTSPLIIDQPEDEIDKAYLFDVLLPALRRLKGKRQVIFSTHDANIVVNGDADNVLFLEAGYDKGRITSQGAIEEDEVKQAIVKTLDGGRDAFELRQVKYGF